MGVFLKHKTQMKKLSVNNNSISDISHLQQKYFNYYLNYSGILSELSELNIYLFWKYSNFDSISINVLTCFKQKPISMN